EAPNYCWPAEVQIPHSTSPARFNHRRAPGWRRGLAGLLLSAGLAVTGCRPDPAATASLGPPAPPPGPFHDVAPPAGPRVRHTTGRPARCLLLQTLGGGCALLDHDGDGRQALLLVSPGEFPGPSAHNLALYRNVTVPGGPLRFEEVTARSGLDVPCGYAQGAV